MKEELRAVKKTDNHKASCVGKKYKTIAGSSPFGDEKECNVKSYF